MSDEKSRQTENCGTSPIIYSIVNYLKFAREFNTRFPGFETDVHGLVKDEDGRYYVDCVCQD